MKRAIAFILSFILVLLPVPIGAFAEQMQADGDAGIEEYSYTEENYLCLTEDTVFENEAVELKGDRIYLCGFSLSLSSVSFITPSGKAPDIYMSDIAGKGKDGICELNIKNTDIGVIYSSCDGILTLRIVQEGGEVLGVANLGAEIFYECLSGSVGFIHGTVDIFGSAEQAPAEKPKDEEIGVGFVPSYASSGETGGKCGDDLTWEYTASSRRLTISGSGRMYDYEPYSAPWEAYRTSIVFLYTEGVDYIGKNAFYGCYSLHTAYLYGVEEIGASAFELATGLTDLYFPNTEIIGERAFYFATDLSSVSFSEKISSIGRNAFFSCRSVMDYNVPAVNSVYKSQDGVLFSHDMKELILYPAAAEFSSYSLPSGVESIAENAFFAAEKLKSVELKDSLYSIGDYAFAGSGLTALALPDGLNFVGTHIIDRAKDLVSLYIGSGISYIPSDFSGNAVSLESIVVSDKNSHYSSRDGVLYDKNKETLIKYPQAKTAPAYFAPSTLKSVAPNGAKGAIYIKYLVLPEGFESIFANAFADAVSLSVLELPSSLKSISANAFLNTSVKTVLFSGSETEYLGISAVIDGNEALVSASVKYDFGGVPDSSAVYSGECGEGVEYKLFSSGTLYIYGNGPMYDYSYSSNSHAPWYVHQKGLYRAILSEGVTSVGYDAFDGCLDLCAASLSSTVESIGWLSFGSCLSLSEIAFPDALVSIGDFAFYSCPLLERADIPDSVRYIGARAFSGTENLRELSLGEGVEHIGAGAFENSGITFISIPESVLCIDEGAFANCYSLKSAELYCSTPILPKRAFENCTALTHVTMASSDISVIREAAFYLCSSLIDVTLPPMLNKIELNAFCQCPEIKYIGGAIPTPELKAMDIAEGNEAITALIPSYRRIYASGNIDNILWVIYDTGDMVITGEGDIPDFHDAAPWYQDKTCVFTVTVGEGITSIGEYAFRGFYFAESFDLPTTLKRIGFGAFENCYGLRHFSFSEMLEDIDGSAFYGATNLVEFSVSEKNSHFTAEDGVVYSKDRSTLVLYPPAKQGDTFIVPEGTEKIAKNAFIFALSLKRVEIPKTVLSLTYHSFAYCSSLETVKLPYSLNSIDSCAFWLCPKLANIEYGGILGAFYTDVRIDKNSGIDKEKISLRYDPDAELSVKRGDLNGDGELSNKDAVLLLQLMAGYDIKYDSFYFSVADMNGDGRITNIDIILILRLLS